MELDQVTADLVFQICVLTSNFEINHNQDILKYICPWTQPKIYVKSHNWKGLIQIEDDVEKSNAETKKFQ